MKLFGKCLVCLPPVFFPLTYFPYFIRKEKHVTPYPRAVCHPSTTTKVKGRFS
jgi:hypothetical protein